MKNIIKALLNACICIGLFALATCSNSKDAVSPNKAGTGGSMARFTVTAGHLYTVGFNTIKVYSLADPANPLFIVEKELGPGLETIFPFKDRLFVGSTSAVYFLSLTDPANPTLESSAQDPVIRFRCDPVVANDTAAFATINVEGTCGNMQSVLVVYDIRDFNKPVKVTEKLLNDPFGLGYKDSILFVCDERYGLHLYNIKNAWNPMLVTTITDNAFIDVIPYYHLLICWTRKGMTLYNISDSSKPKHIADIN